MSVIYQVRNLRASSELGHSEPLDIAPGGLIAGCAYERATRADGTLLAWLDALVWRFPFLSYVGPRTTDNILYGVNNAGTAVGLVGFDNTPTQRATVVKGGATVDVGALVGVGSIALGVNESGLVCGSVFTFGAEGDDRAFIYDSNTGELVTRIDPPPGSVLSAACSINASGETAGTAAGRCCHFREGITTDLGPAAFAEDINQDGLICGSVGRAGPERFAPGIWDSRQPQLGFQPIPLPPFFTGGHAQAINDLGAIVGTCWAPQSYDGQQSAYIHGNGGSVDLNTLIPQPSDWHLESATGINNNGQIVGRGRYLGENAGFLLEVIPPHVPDLVGLLLLGAVTAGGSGLVVLPSGPRPVGPSGPPGIAQLSPPKRDLLLALALDEAAGAFEDQETRLTIRRAVIEAARGRLDALLEIRESPTPGGRFTAPAPSIQVSAARLRRLESGKTELERRAHGLA